MTTHFHFLVASYVVFGLAIVIEIVSLVVARRNALNAVDMDGE